MIPNVKNIIVVSSAKGGVGKSTTAANLAVALASQGHFTGLLDADLYGPSVPTMMNLQAQPELNTRNELLPLTNYGVKTMSIGYLVPPSQAVVWRGLMVSKGIQQLLWQVDWGHLDVLVIDLPPGTGDIQLSITQQLKIAGAIIVSTPQDVSMNDTLKGIKMFELVHVPILGLVQNMSTYCCPNCLHSSFIFGQDGARRKALEMGIEVLCDVPLHADVCLTSDAGKPIVISQPTSQHATVYKELATKIMTKLDSVT